MLCHKVLSFLSMHHRFNELYFDLNILTFLLHHSLLKLTLPEWHSIVKLANNYCFLRMDIVRQKIIEFRFKVRNNIVVQKKLNNDCFFPL